MIQFALFAVLLLLALVAMSVPPAGLLDRLGSDPADAVPGIEAAGGGATPSVPGWLTWGRVSVGIAVASLMIAGVVLARRSTTISSPPRLAVLPFETVGDQEEFVAVGLTEEMTTRLGRLEGLVVVSGSVTRELANAGVPLGTVADELEADFALEGSVTLDGPAGEQRLLVRVRLVDLVTASQVWGEVYDEPADRVFEVEGRIAERVARSMDVFVGESDRLALSAATTESFGAYQSYLDGIGHRRLIRDPEHAWGALESFRRAVDLDPDFAAARAGYASAHLWLAIMHGYAGHLDSARTQVAAATALDPFDADVRMVRALTTSMVELDLQGALEQYESLEPALDARQRTIARGFLRDVNWRMGRTARALDWGWSALELDPHLPTLLVGMAGQLLRTGAFDEAAALVARAHAVGSGDPRVPLFAVLVPLAARGDVAGAWAQLEAIGDPLSVGPAFGAGLDGASRSALRILADRIGIDEVMEGLPDASEAVSAASLLSAGLLAHARSDTGRARVYLEDALGRLEALIANEGSLAPHFRVKVRGACAVALAALGRHAAASELLRETERTLPHPTDRIMREDLDVAFAEVLALAGDVQGARRYLDPLLDGPSWVTDRLLAVDPLWSAARDPDRSS